MLRREPATPLVLPVRDVRVIYGLKSRHYQGFASGSIPHAHEYFVPMDALTAENHALEQRLGRPIRSSTVACLLTARRTPCT